MIFFWNKTYIRCGINKSIFIPHYCAFILLLNLLHPL
jgi:hypothetical protein